MNHGTYFGRVRKQIFWISYLISVFLLALFLSWHVSARVNFLYPFWHDVLNIDATIQKYGPLNRYREDFQLTDKLERTRLFAGIVKAIHQDGKGLESLSYRKPQGQIIGPLLTRPEVIHLQDVARLIGFVNSAAIVIFSLWLIMTGWIFARKTPIPSAMAMFASGAIGLIVSTLVVLLLGPVKIFYLLHEWIFPAGHQWFFYYEESLLTLMMKAPDVFGPITFMLVITALLLCAIFLWIVKRVQVVRAVGMRLR